MTARWMILLFCTVLSSWGGTRGIPWIGVSLDPPKIDRPLEPPLAEGVGLQVSKVIAEGPLAQAGGREGDLWWKFDGQILVNKGQMFVLLRGKAPGEQVRVDFYRNGRLDHLVLTLGNREKHHERWVSFRDKRAHHHERILAKREQVARVEIEGQKLSLEPEENGWRFKVSEEDNTVFSAFVTNDDFQEKVPEKWHQTFLILRLTLGPDRQDADDDPRPRLRYVPRRKSPIETD